MKKVISFTLLLTLITTLGFAQATVPAAQTLPYKQDFAGFSTSSSTYPAGSAIGEEGETEAKIPNFSL